MRFILSILLIAVVSFAGCLFLPWWWIAIAAFITILLLPLSPGKAFISGFSGVFFLWLILTIIISTQNEHILAHRISLLILSTDSPALLIIITSLIGGIVAGMGALSASLMNRLRKN